MWIFVVGAFGYQLTRRNVLLGFESIIVFNSVMLHYTPVALRHWTSFATDFSITMMAGIDYFIILNLYQLSMDGLKIGPQCC